MKLIAAKCISIIGHPLITIPAFTMFALFTHENVVKASRLSLLIIGVIFLPLAVKMYRNTKRGVYTNFDVSQQTQRQSWYLFATALLFIVCVVLFMTEQSRMLRMSVLFGLLLMVASQAVNQYIKSSLHISLNIFLCFLILPMNFGFGLISFGLVILIGWSRLTLKRHTLKEIYIGAVLGFIAGLSFFLSVSHHVTNLGI